MAGPAQSLVLLELLRAKLLQNKRKKKIEANMYKLKLK